MQFLINLINLQKRPVPNIPPQFYPKDVLHLFHYLI